MQLYAVWSCVPTSTHLHSLPVELKVTLLNYYCSDCELNEGKESRFLFAFWPVHQSLVNNYKHSENDCSMNNE